MAAAADRQPPEFEPEDDREDEPRPNVGIAKLTDVNTRTAWSVAVSAFSAAITARGTPSTIATIVP